MPPATTRRLPERPAASTREARIVPPYIPSGPMPASSAGPTPSPAFEQMIEPSPEPELAPTDGHFEDVPEPIEMREPERAAEPEVLEAVTAFESWDDDERDSEGTVEPVFAADTDAVLNELTQHAIETDRKEEFPLDAFIVPEQAQHLPTGLENAAPTPPPEHTPANALAERLEKLSHRLRVEESDAIVRRLAGGDRLDALLAGLLAGYLAGKSEQQ